MENVTTRDNNSMSHQGQIFQLLDSIHQLRDKRCDDWLLMSSIWPTLLLSTSYYIIVRHAGPSFMKNRSASNQHFKPVKQFVITNFNNALYLYSQKSDLTM